MSDHSLNALPIWLINLDGAKKRRAGMRDQLNAMGLNFTRFAAIDGNAQIGSLKQKINKQLYERLMGQKILAGKIGCYFSHLAVWKELANSKASVGLILEDDVVFHEDFLDSLRLALDASDYWDLLKLNSTRAKFPICQGRIGKYRLNAYLGRFTGNACYLLKRETAARIAPTLDEMKLPFEHEISQFDHHNYRLFGLEPFPTHVDDHGVSQITGVRDEKIQKIAGLHRIQHLNFKARNYAHRAAFLLKAGRIPGCSKQLLEFGRQQGD